jgi:hypothetical protein
VNKPRVLKKKKKKNHRAFSLSLSRSRIKTKTTTEPPPILHRVTAADPLQISKNPHSHKNFSFTKKYRPLKSSTAKHELMSSRNFQRHFFFW